MPLVYVTVLDKGEIQHFHGKISPSCESVDTEGRTWEVNDLYSMISFNPMCKVQHEQIHCTEKPV